MAWFRLLRLHEGIGPARARALVAVLRPEAGDVLARWPEAVAHAPAGARTALASTLDGLAEAAPGPPRALEPKPSSVSWRR